MEFGLYVYCRVIILNQVGAFGRGAFNASCSLWASAISSRSTTGPLSASNLFGISMPTVNVIGSFRFQRFGTHPQSSRFACLRVQMRACLQLILYASDQGLGNLFIILKLSLVASSARVSMFPSSESSATCLLGYRFHQPFLHNVVI